jgi:nitroreductase
MEFQDVVRRRRMVRNYTDEPLADGALDRMLANAVRAPSAGFSQGWAFLVFEGRHETAAFWAAVFPPGDRDGFAYPGLFRAPAVVVPLSSKAVYLDRSAEADKGWTDRDESRWPVPYWDIDTGMAALLILQTAVDLGLGALFFGIFPSRLAAFRAAFDVPESWTPIGAITIGHPAPDTPSPSLRGGRGPPADVVHRGSWGGRR